MCGPSKTPEGAPLDFSGSATEGDASSDARCRVTSKILLPVHRCSSAFVVCCIGQLELLVKVEVAPNQRQGWITNVFLPDALGLTSETISIYMAFVFGLEFNSVVPEFALETCARTVTPWEDGTVVTVTIKNRRMPGQYLG